MTITDKKIPAFLKEQRAQMNEAAKNNDFFAALNKFGQIEEAVRDVEQGLSGKSFYNKDIQAFKNEVARASIDYIQAAVDEDRVPEKTPQNASEAIGPYYPVMIRYLNATVKGNSVPSYSIH